jgi:hypothetical protein
MKRTAMNTRTYSRVEPSAPATSVPKADEAVIPRLLTSVEFARELKVSMSWLAKARMRGDGPPYVKIGRSVRYPDPGARDWIEAQSRTSTSEVEAANKAPQDHERKNNLP